LPVGVLGRYRGGPHHLPFLGLAMNSLAICDTSPTMYNLTLKTSPRRLEVHSVAELLPGSGSFALL
jgi:hypothetical protein